MITEKERHRGREKMRRLRADPAYQQWMEKRRQQFDRIKEEIGCARCPAATWSAAALVFHHIDPETKRHELSGNRRVLWAGSLQTEAAKCIVLCGGCHMEMHAILRQDARSYWHEMLALEQAQRIIIDERIAQLVGEQ